MYSPKINKKISVFGCGWLGEPLAYSLIKKGYSINGSTTSESKITTFASGGINAFILSLESLNNKILSFLSAEILIVAIPSKNIEGFKQLISFIEKSTIKKIIFVSSTSVYHNSQDIIKENNPLKECDLANIEQLFQTNSNFETTIIRFAGLFGYNRKPAFFFKNKRPIPNPEGYVNMIHRDDCIKIIEQILIQNSWNEVFNACADSHPTRRAFYTKAFSDCNLELPFFKENDNKTIKIVSNQKLKNLLNYKFKYSNLLSMQLCS